MEIGASTDSTARDQDVARDAECADVASDYSDDDEEAEVQSPLSRLDVDGETFDGDYTVNSVECDTDSGLDYELTGESLRPLMVTRDSGWRLTGRRHHVTYDEWARALHKAPNTESESFALSTSMQSRMASPPLFRNWDTWIVLALIGTITGLIAVTVDKGLDTLYDARMGLNDKIANRVSKDTAGILIQYAFFTASSICFASVAGGLVCFLAPLAAGSGIPEIKCYLNGILLTRVVSIVTLVAKAVGIIFSCSAGLPVGKEGPMIHSGAVIGGIASKYILRIANRFHFQVPLCGSSERRDFVAAGATAGVAAAFGAPMGACLFAIEEGTSHMNPRILLKLFVAAAFAAFISRIVTSLSLSESADFYARLRVGILGTNVPVFFRNFKSMDYAVWELPIFMLMGICGGLIGALFCFLNKKLTLRRKACMAPPKFNSKGWVDISKADCLRFAEVLLVTFCISSLHFWIPMAQIREPIAYENMTDVQKLYFASDTGALRNLLHDETLYEFWMLLVFFVMHMSTACWTYGLGVPSGLFVPSLLGGAAFGRLIGQAMRPIAIAGPGIYALIGATAVLAGAARITISLAMILMEVTGSSSFSLPIFATVMCARWVGNYFGRGIYDLHIIEMKKVPLLEHDPEEHMMEMPAKSIMAKDIVSFQEIEEVQSIYDKLMHCTHNGFPVVRNMRMVGLIRRDILHYLLNEGSSKGILEDPDKILAWDPMARQLSLKRPGLHPIHPDDREKRLDIRPYMSKDFFTMSENACAYSCYNVFRGLGLRHLFVTCERAGKLQGVITRKNLIVAEGQEVDEVRYHQSQQNKMLASIGPRKSQLVDKPMGFAR